MVAEDDQSFQLQEAAPLEMDYQAEYSWCGQRCIVNTIYHISI